MYKNLKGAGIVLLFVFMLVSPRAVFSGASEGLLLWFQIILPTLFPFLLISRLLIITDNIRYISSALGGPVSRLFGVSPQGSFAVITGFLCGYPMGAKTTADLVCTGNITVQEGRYLLSFCNNVSPVFILNFIVWKTWEKEELMLPTLLISIAAPVAVSFFTRRLYMTKGKDAHKFAAPVYQPLKNKKAAWSFEEIDACIMDSFETLVKVGGYIIFFSVLLTLLKTLPVPFLCYFLPTLEITNGILLLQQFSLPFSIWYPASLALISFGGLCSAAQTKCMVQKAGLPVFPYLKEKLAAALTASFMGILYVTLF